MSVVNYFVFVAEVPLAKNGYPARYRNIRLQLIACGEKRFSFEAEDVGKFRNRKLPGNAPAEPRRVQRFAVRSDQVDRIDSLMILLFQLFIDAVEDVVFQFIAGVPRRGARPRRRTPVQPEGLERQRCERQRSICV